MGSLEAKDTREHALSLRGREALLVTGVDHLESFDEEAVVLATTAGLLTVRGQNLHLNKLDLEDGSFEVTGRIASLSYGEDRGGRGLWERLRR